MCGRYALTLAGLDQEPSFAEESTHLELELPWECYNIAPGTTAPILDSDGTLKTSLWGLIPHWSKTPTKRPLFNARSETAATKPSFRTAYKRHRCCVPASGFFEWTGDKKERRPYFIGPATGNLLWFAGLASDWGTDDSAKRSTFTVLTKESVGSSVEEIHHRCPVCLDPSQIEAWLNGTLQVENITEGPGFAEPFAVSREVNKASHDSPSNLLPI